MKILLDECVTRHLRPQLAAHIFCRKGDGLERIKNGTLIALCIGADFDMLLTIDKNLRFSTISKRIR